METGRMFAQLPPETKPGVIEFPCPALLEAHGRWEGVIRFVLLALAAYRD